MPWDTLSLGWRAQRPCHRRRRILLQAPGAGIVWSGTMARKAASEGMWTARTLLELGAVVVAVLAVAFMALFGTPGTSKLQLSMEQVDALMPEVGVDSVVEDGVGMMWSMHSRNLDA